jgi:hypothetical protein
MILQLPSTFLQKIPFYTSYIDDLISSSSNNDDLINFSSLQVDLYESDENKIDSFNDDIEIENENKMKIEKPIFETKLGKKKRGKKSQKN